MARPRSRHRPVGLTRQRGRPRRERLRQPHDRRRADPGHRRGRRGLQRRDEVHRSGPTGPGRRQARRRAQDRAIGVRAEDRGVAHRVDRRQRRRRRRRLRPVRRGARRRRRRAGRDDAAVLPRARRRDRARRGRLRVLVLRRHGVARRRHDRRGRAAAGRVHARRRGGAAGTGPELRLRRQPDRPHDPRVHRLRAEPGGVRAGLRRSERRLDPVRDAGRLRREHGVGHDRRAGHRRTAGHAADSGVDVTEARRWLRRPGRSGFRALRRAQASRRPRWPGSSTWARTQIATSAAGGSSRPSRRAGPGPSGRRTRPARAGLRGGARTVSSATACASRRRRS